jgi:hypothetical protein
MWGSPGGSSARLDFLEHDRYPLAWEELFGSLQGLMLVRSEERCHRDAFGIGALLVTAAANDPFVQETSCSKQ